MADFLGLQPSPTGSTRDTIIWAAWECFRQFGPRKTSVADISRSAGLSRGTVYQYFSDKEAILQATVEQVAARFFRALGQVMDRDSALEAQLASAAAFICQAKPYLKTWEKLYDVEAIAVLLTSGGALLRDCVTFLGPYLEAAQKTGEVRPELDVPMAAEWVARILFSLYSTPSPSVDLDDPEVVRHFVQDYVVAGLAPRAQDPPPA